MTLDEIFAISNEALFRKRFAAWRDQRWKKYGYDRLSDGEKRFVRIQGFCWEVNGNGLQGFFDNSHADMTQEIYDDLRAMGARNAAALLKRAMGTFPKGKVPKDQEQRQDALEKALRKKGASKRLEDLTREFQSSDPDGLRELIWHYVRKNRRHFDTPLAPQPVQARIRFGKPKRQAKLKDYLEYPIWLSAEDVKGGGPGWERPVVSPRNDVSQEVLQYARQICDCPIILFTIEGFTDYGIGQFNNQNKTLISLFLWVGGKWQELGDELGTPSQNMTLVAVPGILGRKKPMFLLKKGKVFAVLAADG